MKKELKFIVRFGYGTLDRVSIGVDELEKALYAQKFGEVALIGGKQIKGNEIKVIEPDYHYYTGWYSSYEPSTGDDFAQIERDCPKGLNDVIRNYRERVDFLINTGRKNLIGKNISLPELDKSKEEIKNLPSDIQDKLNSIGNNFKVK